MVLSPLAVIKTMGSSGADESVPVEGQDPTFPGIAMSSSRQFVSLTTSDARNASADEKASTAKPHSRNRSGSDPRTDSSSSTRPHRVSHAHRENDAEARFAAVHPFVRF